MKPLSPRTVTSSHAPHTSPLRFLGLIPSAAQRTALLILLPALVLISGCTTTTTDRAAKFLASTVQSVDSGMQGYATAVALGVVSAHDQSAVRTLYADYQAAEALAETAITTAIKTGDAGGLASATAALDASKIKLLAFISRFTTAPPKS